MLYADVIVDISHENLDRTYQYRIPEHLEAEAVIGSPVCISFGNRLLKAQYEESRSLCRQNFPLSSVPAQSCEILSRHPFLPCPLCP